MTEDEYERSAVVGAAKCHLVPGGIGAAVGSCVGGPLGGAIGYFVGAILFGAPKALKHDMEYNAQARGRRS